MGRKKPPLYVGGGGYVLRPRFGRKFRGAETKEPRELLHQLGKDIITWETAGGTTRPVKTLVLYRISELAAESIAHTARTRRVSGKNMARQIDGEAAKLKRIFQKYARPMQRHYFGHLEKLGMIKRVKD